MSASLYFDRTDLMTQLHDMVVRIPAVPAKIAVALLAATASASVVALAMSSPALQPAAPAPQVVAVQMFGTQSALVGSCKEQTWPYVDRSCARESNGHSHPPRAVRVISTDRVAPATLNAAPVVLAARPESVDTAPAASSLLGTAPQSARAGSAIASVQPDELVPMPKPRPLQTAAATRQAVAHNVRRALALPPPPIRAEDDEGVQMRAYALPNGHRVTVYRYENPAQRAVISRNDVL